MPWPRNSARQNQRPTTEGRRPKDRDFSGMFASAPQRPMDPAGGVTLGAEWPAFAGMKIWRDFGRSHHRPPPEVARATRPASDHGGAFNFSSTDPVSGGQARC